MQEAGALLPSPGIVAVVAPLALIVALAMAGLVGGLRIRHGIATPYTRKLFHIGIFTSAAGVQLQWGAPAVLVFGAVVSGVVLAATVRGEGLPFYEALARPTDAPHRTMFIIVPLVMTALGGLGSTLVFGRLATVGYLVAGWGDALGEPVGTRWGRHRYRVPSLRGVPATRSIEGSGAVFAGGVCAAAVALAFAGVPTREIALAALAAGGAGAIVEAISNHGLDNLTVQLAAAGAAWLVVN